MVGCVSYDKVPSVVYCQAPRPIVWYDDVDDDDDEDDDVLSRVRVRVR